MKSFKLLALATTATLLTACGGSDDDYAYVRVLHASPDAPAVDVLVDGKAVLTNVQFQQGSGYLRVDEGARTLALRVNGTSTIALQGSFTLSKDNYYSVIAQNDVEELELEVLNDTQRRNNGSNDVTVVHASPDAGSVDIYVTGTDTALENPTLTAVEFDNNASLANIANGDYRVRITPAQVIGVSAAAAPEVVYDSGTLTVNADVTAVAVNSTKGASPVSLLIWNESNTPVIPVLDNSAEVRIVHAVDSVAVDVFAGGNETALLSDFQFKQVNDYLKVAAGSLQVDIAQTGQGIGNAIKSISGTLPLERGESYTVIAAGDLDNVTEAQLIILTDKRASSLTDSGEVRLVHASSASAADPVDIYVYAQGATQPAQPNFSDVVLGQDTGYVTLPNGTYTVVIAADGTTTAAVPGTSAVPVDGGSLQTAIAVGNGSGLSAILLNDCRNCVF